MKIEIKHRITNNVLISGEYISIKDCLEKNQRAYLRGADLRGAYLEGTDLRGSYLRGADLRGADLYGADLEGADLRDIKKYYHSPDICFEIIKRQEIKLFTKEEWEIIGQIIIHRFCWEKLKELYGKKLLSIFKKIAKLGWKDYYRYYQCIIKKEK